MTDPAPRRRRRPTSAVDLDAEVLVAGAGPAGLAAAAACRAAGLAVLTADPAPDRRWPATYAGWVDDVAEYADCLAQQWSDVRAHGHREHRLARPYGRFDNDRLQDRLRASSGTAIASPVDGITRRRRHYEVEVGGGSLKVAAVVDARGERAVLVGDRPPPARQRAIGYVAEFSRPPVEVGGCMLMDWRPADVAADASGRGSASFLYAFDRGDGTVFVEETSLASDPPADFADLRRRLDARLERRGSTPTSIVAVEQVDIAMRRGIPAAPAAIAFGSAGGQLHPFTGYSVAASLRAAPRLAALLAEECCRDIAGSGVHERVWRGLWPVSARRTRALQDYALASLLRLTPTQAMDFFDAFFGLPLTLWRPALDVAATPRQMRAMMLRMFAAVPGGVRARLVSGDPRLLARSVAPRYRSL